MSVEVAFNATTEMNRHWLLPSEFDFPATVLPGRTISIMGNDLIAYHINTGVNAWLQRGRFDVVIVSGWASFAQQLAILACRWRSTPVILWAGSTASEPSLARTLSLPVIRGLVRLSDAYIAYGTAAKSYLEELGAGSECISIAPNTVDVEAWARASSSASSSALRAQLGLVGRTVFLFVGQLIVRKGVDLLLSSFGQLQRRIPHTALLVVGAGPLAERLDCMAAELGLEGVRFVGHVQYAQLPDYFAASDVLVLASRSEVWGLTLNEAMAFGLPVIASDATGASKDLIAHGETGWIASVGNTESLTACLEACASIDTKKRRDMGSAAQRFVLSHFTLQHTVNGFLNAINQTIARSRVGARIQI
jgi:glycosyltransferase involved in cell wall biosynthesis